MILKIIGIVLVLSCVHRSNGASYSKVYVQSGGSDSVPIEYINYGAPAVVADPQIARLSAAPVGSVMSSVIPPCVSPCIVGQNIAPVAPLPNAKFITYNAPNVPVVVAQNKDNGYEYSYVVYDENTGDRKAQREFSDGSVVRGEYSFIQPDGYVREVQYRADDLTGFNVVIKNVLADPAGADGNTQEKTNQPNKEVKNAALKEQPPLELQDTTPIDHSSPDHDCHDHDSDGIEDHDSKDHVDPVTDVEVITPVTEEQTHEELANPPAPEPESIPEPAQVPNETENDIAPEPTTAAPEPTTQAEEDSYQAIVVPDETAPEITPPALPAPLPVPVPAIPIQVPALPASNLVVSYEDIIRCFQSKAQSAQNLNISPLTYILLPAANLPC